MTLFDRFKRHIILPDGAVEAAMRRSLPPDRNTPEYIKQNFSRLVEDIQEEAYRVYLNSEKQAGQTAMREYLSEIITLDADRETTMSAVSECFNDFDRFFLSLTQSRRARAGSAFETVIRTFFRKLDYPFEEQQIINGKPDFLLPSRQHYVDNAMDCLLVTVKRTLRERWRQIVTEGRGSSSFYLATIDGGLSRTQLDEMRANRIHIVVPAEIKEDKYSTALNVLTFEHFFTHHLDPAVARWRDQGII